jgi:hypothetical protein
VNLDHPLGTWVAHNGRRRGFITAVSTTTRVLYLQDADGAQWCAFADDCTPLRGRIPEPMPPEPSQLAPTALAPIPDGPWKALLRERLSARLSRP